jgi:MYXO-CTERM domain-containing protein
MSGQGTATVVTLNISGASSLTQTSGTTLTVNGILKSGNSSATISGGTIKPGSNQELVIRTDQASDSLTISSAIVKNVTSSNTNSLTKSGAGTLTLTATASDSFTGNTYIDGGVLSVSNLTATTGNLPSGSINIEGGTLLYTGGSTTFTKAVNSGFGGGTINVVGGTTLTIQAGCTGANTGFAVDALVKTGSGILALTGASGTDNSGFYIAVNAGTLQLGKTTTSSVHAVSGLIVNSGGLAQITGNNGDEIYDGSNVTVNGTGQLDFNGKNEGFDGLSGTGTLTNNGGANSTVTLGTNGNLSANSMDVFQGNITDGAKKMALIKANSGTQTLAGASTYSGGTTVQAGTLLVDNTTGSATGTGPVTVQSGTLGGTGSVGGLLTIDSGATLAPGSTTFGAGSINLMSGADLVFTLGADRVIDSGGLTLGTTINLTLSGTSLSPGTYDLIDFSGTLTNNSSNFSGWTVTGVPTGDTANFILTSSALQLQVVDPTPEPGSGLLLALGVVGLGGRRARRRVRS